MRRFNTLVITLICVLSISSYASEDPLFPDPVSLYNVNQFPSPVVQGGDIQDERAYSLFVFYDKQRYNTLHSNGEEVTPESLLTTYTAAPKSLVSERYTILLTSGITPTFNVSAHLGVIKHTQTAVFQEPGDTTITEDELSSIGLMDLHIAVIQNALSTEKWAVRFHYGLNIPLGKMEVSDKFGAYSSRALGYMMQHSSGTIDLEPKVTVLRYFDSFSLGGQFGTVLRTKRARFNFAYGNEVHGHLWATKAWVSMLSTFARVSWGFQQESDGAHPDLDTTFSPTMDPENLGYTYAELGLGAYVYLDWWIFSNTRFYSEWTKPLYKKVEGTQLIEENRVRVGIRSLFI